MSKITLKQLLDLHGLDEGDEFVVRGDDCDYKIVSGKVCRRLIGVGFNPLEIICGASTLVEAEINITKKAPQKPKYGERYFTIGTLEVKWKDDCFDNEYLNKGLVFSDEDEAEYRLEEMIRLWKEKSNA